MRPSTPVCASHILRVLSVEAETIQAPSGLTAQPRSQWVCPLKVRHSVPLCESHTLRVLSLEAETIQVPSGLIAQLFTQSVCPCRVRTSAGCGRSGNGCCASSNGRESSRWNWSLREEISFTKHREHSSVFST